MEIVYFLYGGNFRTFQTHLVRFKFYIVAQLSSEWTALVACSTADRICSLVLGLSCHRGNSDLFLLALDEKSRNYQSNPFFKDQAVSSYNKFHGNPSQRLWHVLLKVFISTEGQTVPLATWLVWLKTKNCPWGSWEFVSLPQLALLWAYKSDLTKGRLCRLSTGTVSSCFGQSV